LTSELRKFEKLQLTTFPCLSRNTEESIEGLDEKPGLDEIRHFEDLGVDGRIVLEQTLKCLRECRTELSGSG
jgi:hypothetical protein